jgi:hypothetical protein
MSRAGKIVMGTAVVAFVAGSAWAQVHDESINGDLSGDPLAPTPITAGLGSNVVTGSMVNPSDTRDYMTFTVGPGQQLTGIFLLDYTDLNVGGPGNRGFIHIDDGSTSVIPDFSTTDQFLGGSHLDRGLFPTASDNMLDRLALAVQGGVGFTTPLGPGDYVVNVQQTGPQLTGYAIDLVIVPAPATAGALALAALASTRRRRARA